MLWKASILTVGGLGRLRPAPGTWGSMPPCALVLLLGLLGTEVWVTQCALALLVVLACFGCIMLGGWGEQHWQTKDPGVIVLDEVAGMSLGLLLVPLPAVTLAASGDGGGGGGGAAGDAMATGWLALNGDAGFGGLIAIAASAFILFRIFDIIKVPPANVMQQLPAGWGVLLDDLIAGLYTNVVLQVFLRLALPLLTAAGGSTAAGGLG